MRSLDVTVSHHKNMLTQKQENFVNNIFQGFTQRESWIKAGYSSNYALDIVDRHASKLANKDEIKGRLEELRQPVKAALIKSEIATAEERQRILTELARGNLLDYQESGLDGGYISIGKDSPNTRSISELTTRTDENGTIITKVKIHSQTQAIDLLNKMDKLYSEGVTINQDNRVINFIVKDKSQADRMQGLVEGISKRTGKLIGGDDAV